MDVHVFKYTWCEFRKKNTVRIKKNWNKCVVSMVFVKLGKGAVVWGGR